MALPISELMGRVRQAAQGGISGYYTCATLVHLTQSLYRIILRDTPDGIWVIGHHHADWVHLAMEDVAASVQRIELVASHDPASGCGIIGIGASCGFIVVAIPSEAAQDDANLRLYDVAWSCHPEVLRSLDEVLRGVIDAPVFPRLYHLHVPEATFLLQLSGELLADSTYQQQRLAYINLSLRERIRSHEDQTHMIIHDMRTPLHTLQISIKTLQRFASEVQGELLEVARETTNYLLNMTETMLDVARLETSRWRLNLQPVVMHELIHKVCAPLELAARPDQAPIHHAVEPDLPLIWIDRTLLQRVLLNLISNAIRYTPANGSIHVEVRRQSATELAIHVHDTGQGIHPDAIPHIFERYYQATQRDARRGNGLGLYFCRLAVEAHGGSITVQSMPDAGSQFVISLPLRIEPEEI
ncbi:histidine kinase [Oscillochloris trichoides DG-6]|uniref:histidine kinase n=1 Tax=Oscillochloris trichoides DG-6 TaxID=765420 RepID=E1IC34_9CHLR|nr:ATP-binding protein [Oscillochloris trichoides]EFO81224.1 histidine kinase [Oscillochloris trichoides DG-6]